MYISRASIKNFRSLAEVEISLDGYTALVGLNDSGKSNLLRALNLFFNGQTDPGKELDFPRDFSQQGKVIGGKARQIEIELEFSPPKNYSDNGPVIWRRIFRAESTAPFSELLIRKSGEDFSSGSRVAYWVKNLKYEYVPAIRGESFFVILKRRLYTALAATVAHKLTTASGAFLKELRKELSAIESESKRLLDLQTEFSLPGDLGELFETLDFDAADAHSRTALKNRGDGIQGRHVPVILKFLADQRKINSAKGKPPEETIWGFEEPENNLELSKQMEVAQEFEQYSKSIQILVSTHSPAFYGSALTANGVRVARRIAGKTAFNNTFPAENIDEHLGLMPFIQPYLEKAVAERDQLVQSIKSLRENVLVPKKAALYVEGKTDSDILSATFKSLGIKPNFEIHTKDHGAGVNWIVGCCIARASLTDLNEKTAALFDNDAAGREALAKIDRQCAAIGRTGKIKHFVVGKNNGDDEIREIKKKKINIPICIEELAGPAIWEYAEAKGWLEERENLVKQNSHLLDSKTTLTQILDSLIGANLHARRLVEFQVIHDNKSKVANQLCKFLLTDVPSPSLEALAREIADYFGC